jgi:hypothetical protein
VDLECAPAVNDLRDFVAGRIHPSCVSCWILLVQEMDSLLEPEDSIVRPPWGEFGRVFTLGLVSLTSKFWLQGVCNFEVTGREALEKYVDDREAGRGLITVSNHTRCSCIPLTS